MFKVLSFVLALSVASSLSAVTLQQLSVDELTQNATAIVRARVVGSSASLTGSTIYTHYKLQTSETWKGFPAAEVMVPGGVVKGTRQSFPGMPELTVGTEYVLFLWTSPAGITHLLGMPQGVFNVTEQDDGSLLATRPHIGEMMLDRSGLRVADTGLQMRLTDLRTHVSRVTASGVAR